MTSTTLRAQQDHICGNSFIEQDLDEGDARGQNCQRNSSAYMDKYRSPGHWIPNWPITPPKTIKVNFVIFRDDLGQNGWPDTQYYRDEFASLVWNVSNVYNAPGWRNYPSQCPTPDPYAFYVPDSYIRFELNNIYFFDNSRFNNAYHPSYTDDSANKATAQEILTWLWSNYPETKEAMNHIFTRPGWDNTLAGHTAQNPRYASYQGYYTTYSNHSYVHSINLFNEWDVNNLGHLAHEYGHAVGSDHTYGNNQNWNGDNAEYRSIDHFDFLDDVFGNCPEPIVMDGGNPCFNDPSDACSPPPGKVCYLQCFFGNFAPSYPLMSGVWPNKFISSKMAGRMHRALSLFDVSFKMNNRPMHQYVKEKHSWITPYTVSSDETWDFAIKMYQDIVVESGTTLTLTCEVRMPIGGKIIVKPNARLIIDGGVVTCAHEGEFWQGVEVWGTTDQHQSPSSHPTYQGLVILKNDAVIEHAELAVRLWRPDDWNSVGGAAQVLGNATTIGGTFLNCTGAVEFRKYRNFNPNSPNMTRNNISHFDNARFIIDPDYRGGDDDFRSHVHIWDVRGVSFLRCEFRNDRMGVAQSHQLGNGISSYDATFSVRGVCATNYCLQNPGQPMPPCPEGSLNPTRFIGLGHGIHIHGGLRKGRSVKIMNCYFEDNICGIVSDASHHTEIIRNEFIVGGREVGELSGFDWPFGSYHRAVFSHVGNFFRIEENKIRRHENAIAPAEGIVISRTKKRNELVYKNSARVENGFVGENECLHPLYPTQHGLAFHCNNREDGEERTYEHDFLVRQTSLWESAGIKMFQGSVDESAGNGFTPEELGGGGFYNYFNEPEIYPITYFGEPPPGLLNENAYNFPYVSLIENEPRACPTRQICAELQHVVAVSKSAMITSQTAHFNLRYVFESLMDGGDYEGLREIIMESWPQDAWDLRDELMARSPYLSVDILFETARRNILPQAMMLEVCLANPEATQQARFVEWMRTEAPDPMPEYMISQIIASWDERTWRTSLESAMSKQLMDGQYHATIALGAMLQDTLDYPQDSVLSVVRFDISLEARYTEAQFLMEYDRYDEAMDLLDSLEETYLMDEDELQERDGLREMMAFSRELELEGRQIMDLSDGQIAYLNSKAEFVPSPAAVLAMNILSFGYGFSYTPFTGGSLSPKFKPHPPSVQPQLIEGSAILTAHPNPAKNWVALGYVLQAKGNAVINIRDIQGRNLTTFKIASDEGQHVWDTRSLPAGVYTAELLVDGMMMDVKRIILE